MRNLSFKCFTLLSLTLPRGHRIELTTLHTTQTPLFMLFSLPHFPLFTLQLNSYSLCLCPSSINGFSYLEAFFIIVLASLSPLSLGIKINTIQI
ncbi:hypothetical protein VNO78_15499 [Psophocarpus tetragonolobus]|uniref:Uncharacterized protein n=1 Tax=Psophocarpus tetragonolobus TaxID=3891 RepID=A0AAN9SIW6_PSOTE